MQDRIKAGTIARVLMASPDRLACHDVHPMVLHEAFAQAACRVECLDQLLGQDPQARQLSHIRSAVVACERTLVAERKRPRKRQAGVLLPWTIPSYRYRLHPDRPHDLDGVPSEPTEGAIVAPPHEPPLVRDREHTSHGLK
jgi:hypothetical protein